VDYFSPIFGLITKADPITENGGLFLAQYHASKRDKKGFDIYLQKMNNAKTEKGLYMRSANHKERGVSHDEITGMMASSHLFQTIHKDIIWSQLKENFGAYPSVVKDWSDRLPYNPANYYNWGQYVGSKFSYVFLPFYVANMFLAIKEGKSETGSKLIYWLELETMPDSIINRTLKNFFQKEMKKQYGENFLFEMRKIYFSQENESEFPLFTVLKEQE
jgi:hypothetical protein